MKAPFGAFGYPPGVKITNPEPCAYNPNIVWWSWPNGMRMWVESAV